MASLKLDILTRSTTGVLYTFLQHTLYSTLSSIIPLDFHSLVFPVPMSFLDIAFQFTALNSIQTSTRPSPAQPKSRMAQRVEVAVQRMFSGLASPWTCASTKVHPEHLKRKHLRHKQECGNDHQVPWQDPMDPVPPQKLQNVDQRNLSLHHMVSVWFIQAATCASTTSAICRKAFTSEAVR